jgi:hypothetical protein
MFHTFFNNYTLYSCIIQGCAHGLRKAKQIRGFILDSGAHGEE